MNKWRLMTIGDLISIQRGHDLTYVEREAGLVPVFGAAGQNGFHSKAIASAPGIVIGRSGGSFGQVHFVNEDFWPHNTALYVKDFKGNDPKYVYYLLKILDFSSLNSGSAQPSLNRNYLYPVKIRIPQPKEQKRISKILADLDSKIELNNKINAELEAMAKLIYDYWFVQFEFPIEAALAAKMGDSSLAGKPYKSSGGPMVYNQALKREIPEGWEVKELGSQINIFDSMRIPLSRQQREKRRGKIPYYGATEVMDYIDDFLFDDDYILLAEDGSVMNSEGMPIVQFIWGKTWVNNHAHVIQAKTKAHNEFLFQLVKRIPVVLIKTGSIQMKINQENLKSYKVLLPDELLISQFSKMASETRKSLINNTKQNQELSSLRDWLLPMLMNGQVTIKEAEEHPEIYRESMAADERGDYGK